MAHEKPQEIQDTEHKIDFLLGYKVESTLHRGIITTKAKLCLEATDKVLNVFEP